MSLGTSEKRSKLCVLHAREYGRGGRKKEDGLELGEDGMEGEPREGICL